MPAKPRRKHKQKLSKRRPASPLPSMQIRLRLLTRGTSASDFGLNAIFAREGADPDAR